jgi:hypothetical protein
VEVQTLFDRVMSRLKGGKGKMMSFKGRLILINSVVTVTATYFLTIFPASAGFIQKLDKLRSFLWAPDEETIAGGKCMVSWKKVCAPLVYGGLGIKDLKAYSRALRLRWEWFRWTDQGRPWVGTKMPCDQVDKDLFAACTRIMLGNGETASFWTNRWLNGQALCSMAPLCFPLAARKKLTVRQALASGWWMKGLQNINSEVQLDQFIELWTRLQQVDLISGQHDTIT